MKTDVRINNTIVDDSCSMLLNAELSPEFLAKLFWNMDDKGQARFFNYLGSEVNDWAFAIQMGSVTEMEMLTDDARSMMSIIGDHAEKRTKEA